MAGALGSDGNPLRVAIVGSGPSGFYATEALFRSGKVVSVDMYDRLPTPFGLVRGGVAPDHPKIKQVNLVFDKIAKTSGFTFLGNVCIGVDLDVAALREAYHAVVFAYGAATDRRLGIPGEDLPGNHTATEFVGWYNGHPDYCDHRFDLSAEAVAIIGQGNVAADLARILATPVDALRKTDIAQHALDVLASSCVRDIFVIGRRGPAQAKFTPAELRELGQIENCAVVVDPADLILNPESEAEIATSQADTAKKNVEIFRAFAERKWDRAARAIHFRFLETPCAIGGDGRVATLRLAKNTLSGPAFDQSAAPMGAMLNLPCGLIFRSVGYKGLPLPGLPFDPARGIIPNKAGRIVENGQSVPGLYATGWIKRGPSGIIGTNRPDAIETAASLLSDLPLLDARPRAGFACVQPALAQRGVRIVSFADWLTIDRVERQNGVQRGKPREKFVRLRDMLRALGL